MSSSLFKQRYSIIEVIASKPNKKTYIVKDKEGMYHVAKQFHINDEEVLKETEVMRTIRHPNIVEFHDLIVDKNHTYLVEEFCEEGDLEFHIRRQIKKKKTFFPEQQVAQWLLQVLLALEYLQNAKIMHRDIRPQNIFLTSKGNVKLGSFRASKVFESQTDLAVTALGSPYYMAPEFVQQHTYDFKIDIWAYGCFLFEICTLKPLYTTTNMVQLAQKIVKCKVEELPVCYSKHLNLILGKCLKKKPNQRPSARELLRTPYFLDSMQAFVIKKGIIMSQQVRIPIKKYKIHLKVLENAKLKRNLNRLILREKKEEEKEQFPKLQIHSTKGERKSIIEQMKHMPKTPIQQLPKRKNTKSFEKIRKMSAQKYIVEELAAKNQNSKDKSKKKSVNKTLKVENGIKYSPKIAVKGNQSQQKKQKIKNLSQQKKPSMEKVQKQEKKKLLPPPMLPRPAYKNPQQKKQDKKNKITNLSETANSKELQNELNHLKISKENYIPQNQEIRENLAKVFSDLNIEEDDEEQFSFDLEEEKIARLTSKQNEGKDILKTYKSKFSQLIEEINYKYCPNMQTIQERTAQFDSNTFAQFHQ